MIFSAYKIIIPLNWNLTQNFCIHNIMSNTYLSLWTASKSKDDLKKCGWLFNNEQDCTLLLVKPPLSSIFRQHAVSIYGFVRYVSKEGRRPRFGMLTALTKYKINHGLMVGGRRSLVEDVLWWKMTYGGRRPLVGDDSWWKRAYGGRRPSVEDDLRWKTTFGGRQISLEDNLWWEDNLRWILACCLLRFAAFFA